MRPAARRPAEPQSPWPEIAAVAGVFLHLLPEQAYVHPAVNVAGSDPAARIRQFLTEHDRFQPPPIFSVLRTAALLPFCRYVEKHPLAASFFDYFIVFSLLARGGIVSRYRGHYAYHNTNYIHCLVALNEKDEIRAHAFSYLENTYQLGNHVHILQIWKSEGGSEIIEQGMKLIDEYAVETKCKTIIYSADSLGKLRLYNRYGFHLHRVYGRKDVI